MQIEQAISEPFVKLIEFHDQLNRNIKISVGALEKLSESKPTDGMVELPTRNEPWGKNTKWKELSTPLDEAVGFIAEMGIVRASAAFEDYLTGAKAEFDRAGLSPSDLKGAGATALQGFDAVLGLSTDAICHYLSLAKFFTEARNCIVHQSNRANRSLADLRKNPDFLASLQARPKRSGKWNLSIPEVERGIAVTWMPRHAIFASDVFYQCSKLLDRKLVNLMGEKNLVQMAVHWGFFADPITPCSAKLNSETFVRTLLEQRYFVRQTTIPELVRILHNIGIRKQVEKAFSARFRRELKTPKENT